MDRIELANDIILMAEAIKRDLFDDGVKHSRQFMDIAKAAMSASILMENV